ncbi:uncharacterized protein LOC126834729 isoform X1 [Adelges cooleyi]|uniref:uncharacterized protein LOC126834729 isoform X1 n=1 Tax=Adelges cooleyi TaxID=133065 RepID=UPI00217FDD86|nr:uncharacterized protein LOC126834729 isoform X1 [Adelges cooleyi]
MYIEYIILLYFYIPMVNSNNNEELEDVFNFIRDGNEDYATYGGMLRHFKGEDSNELEKIVTNYGHKYTDDDGIDEYRLYFHKFQEAASEGLIPRWPKQAMYYLFVRIIRDINRDYITNDDMTRCYGIRYPELDLEKIMEDYGESIDGVRHLTFENFRRVMNLGHLPAPQQWICNPGSQ